MSSKEYVREMSFWGVPALYAAVAIATGFTIPVLEDRIFPGFISPMSLSSAIAIYSSIASGMIALTGIVFSLAFVMVQFSATAYSPRLVVWIARDRVILHSLGIFIATFLYSCGARRDRPTWVGARSIFQCVPESGAPVGQCRNVYRADQQGRATSD